MLERLDPGLVAVRYSTWHDTDDESLWALARLRKPTTCAVTGRDLEKGEEAWRPVGNQVYRGHRIAKEVLT